MLERMSSSYQQNDFDVLIEDLCDCDWDNTSKESSVDLSSLSYESSVPVNSRKIVRLDSRGNRKVKVKHGDRAYDFEVHYPRPRIVSTDIRRSFANMFVNVMNSGEFPLMFGFLDTFFSPNITRISRKTFISEAAPYKSSSQDGVMEIARHWYNSNKYAPDTVVTLNNTRLLTYSDGAESMLVTGIRLSCTRVFDDQFSAMIKSEPSVIESTVLSRDSQTSESDSSDRNSSSSSSSNGIKGFTMNSEYLSAPSVGSKRTAASVSDVPSILQSTMKSMDKDMSRLRLRERPVRLVGVGELSMVFNANRTISKMVMSVKVDLEENSSGG